MKTDTPNYDEYLRRVASRPIAEGDRELRHLAIDLDRRLYNAINAIASHIAAIDAMHNYLDTTDDVLIVPTKTWERLDRKRVSALASLRAAMDKELSLRG